MAYRTLETVLHPDSHLALTPEELPQRLGRVMVVILEAGETDTQTNDPDIDQERKR